jgi:hypothetical protein
MAESWAALLDSQSPREETPFSPSQELGEVNSLFLLTLLRT